MLRFASQSYGSAVLASTDAVSTRGVVQLRQWGAAHSRFMGTKPKVKTLYPFVAPMKTRHRGVGIVHNPITNKGTGFSLSERDRLRIRGLVPPRMLSLEEQTDKMLSRMQSLPSDLDRGIELQALQDRNETLFYRLLIDHIEELAPCVYTPTVGKLCKRFGSYFRRTRGMYFSTQDRGLMSSMIYNWPHDDVNVVVVTDGSRILGLGDLGANGMGIPIGKLALYVAAGGIDPRRTLPIMLDAGTDNEELLSNPHYLGVQHRRLQGDAYYSLVDELMNSIHRRFPKALIQFEDFQTKHAFPLLQRYRNRMLTFNDDYDGTGATALAGLLSAVSVQGKGLSLKDQRIMVCGAGSAGMGVAHAIHRAMVREGLSDKDAASRFWVMTDKGLLGHDEPEVSDQQQLFQRQDKPSGAGIQDVIREAKPTVLLGLTGAAGIWTESVIKEMAKHNDRPIIFPLSNPTANAECTAEQAYNWTNGSCIFAGGSPFGPVTVNGKTFAPSQCNNMFIFPGVGLGSVLVESRRVTDSMFYKAAQALASSLNDEERELGMVFPKVSRIREVTVNVAAAVGEEAMMSGNSLLNPSGFNKDFVERSMYDPHYRPVIPVNDY